MRRQRWQYFLQYIGPVEERRKRAAKAKKKGSSKRYSVDLTTAVANMATDSCSFPGVDQGLEDLEEEVQQSGSVWTVPCVEEKAPVKVPSRFAILEDEELEFEAPSGLEVRKTAALLARKYAGDDH